MKSKYSYSFQMAQSAQILNNQSIFQIQNKSSVISQMTPQQVMKNMTQQHKTILKKMNKLDQLNNTFQQKQQQMFFKTFLNIMDRMSNQLTHYQQKIRDIDQQIARDQKCVILANQMNFFRNQCIQLRKQYQTIEGQIVKQKNKNQVLEDKKNQLCNGLFKKSKEHYKYKVRANSLQLCYEQNSFIQQKQKEKQRKLRTAYNGSLYTRTPIGKGIQKANTEININYKTANINNKRNTSSNDLPLNKKQFFSSIKNRRHSFNKSKSFYRKESLLNQNLGKKTQF